MSVEEQQAAYLELSHAIQQLDCPDGVLRQSLQTFLQPLGDAIPWDQNGQMIQALKALIEHFSAACDLDPVYAQALGNLLAEATKRKQLWRSLFGIPIQTSVVAFDSVLHVSLQLKLFHDRKVTALVTDCLRLIANCCADNDVNRKFCLENNVLKDLLELSINRVEPDLVIPTIYNICIDYTEPVAETFPPIEGMSEGVLESSIQPSQASFLAAVKLLEASQQQFAAHQILLSLEPWCSEDRKAYLAELVELACLSFAQNKDATNSSDLAPDWCFAIDDRSLDTLTIMIDLAEDRADCMYHMLRSVTSLLANQNQCRLLLKNNSRMITKLVYLIALSSPDDDANDDDDESMQEEIRARNEIFKAFYQLTSMPEFVSEAQAHEVLIEESMVALTEPDGLPTESGHRYMMICYIIILAQLAAVSSIRERLLSDPRLKEMLQDFLVESDDNDMLYPTMTLISRLCRTDQPDLILIQPSILQQMTRLMTGKGRGLSIPFEAVDAFRMMMRNRPHKFNLFVEGDGANNVNVISAVSELFEKTIEAGTKLAAGHFFMEVLRTMFASTKDLDDISRKQTTPVTAMFLDFLDRHAIEVGSIFAYVCSRAEPREQRVHGWFALGMLSVWRQGRMAIVQAMDDDDFRNSLSDISTTEGPGAQNAKLMCSKMQLCSDEEISTSHRLVLQNAAQELGIDFKCVT